jgi:hypothetical protein
MRSITQRLQRSLSSDRCNWRSLSSLPSAAFSSAAATPTASSSKVVAVNGIKYALPHHGRPIVGICLDGSAQQ